MAFSKKIQSALGRGLDFVDRRPFLSLVRELVERYFEHDVGRSGAALAYYLIFSFFPFLIFVSMLVGFLRLPLVGVGSQLHRFIPDEIIQIINIFLEHVTEMRSSTAMVMGLVFTVFFSMRAVDALMAAVIRAYAAREARGPVAHQVLVLFFTIFLMFSIFASLLLITIGQRLLTFAARFIPISAGAIQLWDSLRFPLLGAILFVVLTLLYGLSLKKRPPLRYVYPGAVVSMGAWLILSAGFSFYVENLGRYSVLYGSIGAVIVLLLWLYLSAVVLIMGAEFNAALAGRRKRPPLAKGPGREKA